MDLSGLAQFTIDGVREEVDGLVLSGRLSHPRGVRLS
jgi:hypothetical protein